MSKKTVYVTGCFGLIGGHVTEICLKKGWQVRGVDKLTFASNQKLWGKKFEKFDSFEFLNEDIRDLRSLPNCDYVINTAAETHVDNSIASSKSFMDSNVHGVYNLLEILRGKSQTKKPVLLHFSTDEVMGDCDDNGAGYDEFQLLDPSNPYSASKAAADMLILAWNRTYGVPFVIVRPSNNYGIGQYVEKLIPLSCKLFSEGKPVPLHLGGKPKRVWLHAHDTARAIVKIIEKNIENEIFNISGDEEHKNIDVVRRVFEFSGKKERDFESFIDTSFERRGVDIRYKIDDRKIRKMTGWAPEKSLLDEIPSISNYYQNNFIW
jgi:dTDP-glucose 4,6-dehydratase